ncbi:MAG: alkaline phosphatase family protein [Phycisphaerae bacterium]
MIERIRFAFIALAGLFLSLLPLGCGVPGPDGPPDTFGVDFSLPEGSITGGAIIFLVDGVNAATFNELLEAGELPAMKSYFADRGLYVPRAAAGHTSLTMDNLVSITTGVFPGHHGLIGAKWFDRNRLTFRNYETLHDKNSLEENLHVPTIYEQFPGRLTFSLFLQPHKGSTHFFENRISAGPAFLLYLYGLVDRIALNGFKTEMDIARQYRQFPAVTAIYQLAVNFAAYSHKASSQEYRQAIRDMDYRFGRVLGDLKRAGMLDKVVIAFVADHGHCDTPNHAKAVEYIESLGINLPTDAPVGEDKPFQDRVKHFHKFVGVQYGISDRYWALWLRKPVTIDGKQTWGPWLDRPTPEELRNYPTRLGKTDLPALIVKQEWVDAVAYRVKPGVVRLVRKGGEVEFRRVPRAQGAAGPESLTYHVISGDDPLEWAARLPAKALAGEPMTDREWLEATAGTQFPDLGTGLLTAFESDRIGDLSIYAAPGWDINGWRKAGHGGIRDVEMFSPMLIAGPGIPHGRIAVARTVDLVPTLLEALDKPLPPGLDGRSLIHWSP